MTFNVYIRYGNQCFVYYTQHIEDGRRSYGIIRNDYWCIAVNDACIWTHE